MSGNNDNTIPVATPEQGQAGYAPQQQPYPPQQQQQYPPAPANEKQQMGMAPPAYEQQPTPPQPTYGETSFTGLGSTQPQVQQTQYVTQQPGATTTTYVTTTVAQLGPGPQLYPCKNCGQTAMTRVEYEMGSFGWIATGLGCFVCLCCVPPLVDSFKDSTHKCGHCGSYIGRFERKI